MTMLGIKGMTDIATLRDRSGMPRLGELRKGSAKKKVKKTGKDGKPYEQEITGDDLTYFRFTSKSASIADRFDKLFSKGKGSAPGEGPENAISFFLPYDDLYKSFPAAMAYYRGSSEYTRCDRESIYSERLTSPRGGPWENIAGDVVGTDKVGMPATKWVDYSEAQRPPCRFPNCAMGTKGFEPCSAKSGLKIEIRELGEYGIVTVLMGAKNDIPHVMGILHEIKEKADAMGVGLSQIPLLLWRSHRGISAPSFSDPSKRQRVQKSLVEVGIDLKLWEKLFEQRSQFALNSVGGNVHQLEPAKDLRLPAAERPDEFGDRPSMDFMRTAEWKDLKMKFEQSRSLAEVDVAAACGQSLIRDGKLAPTAKNQIEFAATDAQRRIEESGVVPIEPIEVEFEEEMSTAGRFRAIGDRTGHTMAQIEAMANGLKFSEDVSTWDAKQCRTLRNRLYAKCDRAIKAFGSGESAAAEYQAFMDADLVDFLDDVAVWDAWSAIAA
jgi:Recombination directionality factor-like